MHLLRLLRRGRTKRWARAAIWSGGMVALTRRGLVNAVVTGVTRGSLGLWNRRQETPDGMGYAVHCDAPRWEDRSVSFVWIAIRTSP